MLICFVYERCIEIGCVDALYYIFVSSCDSTQPAIWLAFYCSLAVGGAALLLSG